MVEGLSFITVKLPDIAPFGFFDRFSRHDGREKTTKAAR
jgi:hypothetical protein